MARASIRWRSGATALIRLSDGTLSLGGGAEVEILSPEAGAFRAEVASGEVFVNVRGALELDFVEKEIAFEDAAALLAGDATELSERIAIKAFPDHYLRANVLKVGHHGSKTSTSNRFLSAVKPELAVVSVGAENGYGLPDESVLQRLLDAGARVLRTDKDGTVRIALDGTRVWVVE